MLERLKLANFKTWESADLRFGRITGLFGTNSSGKSSLLQFLLLMKQTKEATDRAATFDLNGTYVRLGVFQDLIHKHDSARPLSWEIRFRSDEKLGLIDRSERRNTEIARGDRIRVSGEAAANGTQVRARRLEYRLGDAGFILAPRSAEDAAFELSAAAGEFRFRRTQGRPWQLPGPIKSYEFPDQARTYFQNASFLADLEFKFEEQLDRVFYLGPLRDPPHRDYLWSHGRPADVGTRGEKAIEAILAATEAREQRNLAYRARLQPFQGMIAHWLRHMGLIRAFKVEEIAAGSNRWQARVTVIDGGSEALLTDVGFGVSQVLPVVTLLQYAPKGATVLLEQPELHLHPLAQADLADAIIHAATVRGVQVVVESHSEHLLLRLQRRVAEGGLSAGDLRLWFCSAHAGGSHLEPLQLDLLGRIENWPDRFMGDAFGETAAAELARLKRQAAAE